MTPGAAAGPPLEPTRRHPERPWSARGAAPRVAAAAARPKHVCFDHLCYRGGRSQLRPSVSVTEVVGQGLFEASQRPAAPKDLLRVSPRPVWRTLSPLGPSPPGTLWGAPSGAQDPPCAPSGAPSGPHDLPARPAALGLGMRRAPFLARRRTRSCPQGASRSRLPHSFTTPSSIRHDTGSFQGAEGEPQTDRTRRNCGAFRG